MSTRAAAKSEYSMVKETLKNLCYTDGWCYGILWGFDQSNSLLLTLKDAYCKEEMAALMDSVMLQVHFLGEGVIGQVAFTRSNKWMFSDSHHGRQNPLGSLESLHLLQEDSEFHRQFSMGIKTIALISVEQWGVIQLGSTQKVAQRKEFIQQVKEIFRGIDKSQDIELSENSASSSDQFMDSHTQMMSGLVNNNFQYGAEFEDLIVTGQPSDVPSQSFATALDHQNINSLFTPSFMFEDHIQIGSKPTVSEPGTSTGDCSILASSWPNLGSEWNEYLPSAECSKDMLNSQNPTLLSLDDLLHGISFREDLSKRCTAGDYSEWFCPLQGNEISHANGFTLLSSFGGHNSPNNVSENVPANSIQSSVTYAFKANREDNYSDTCAIDHQFDGFAGCKKVQGRNETLGPVTGADVLNFSSGSSECISGEYEKSRVRPSNSLFSQLGLDQILNGMAGSSCSPKRRKIESYSYSQSQGKVQGLPNFDEEVKSVITGCQPDRTRSMNELNNCEGFLRHTSLYGGDSSSSSPMRQVELVKKKKAKPGSKPRPKDRQMIQDRLAELRDLIPNGEKMSIDRLLERTIRHLNFMQGVKKHAESVKNIDLQKGERKEKDLSSKGATWACELGDQSMTCPLIIEDLSTPGQMLIEILCEEHSFFLEIADVIRSFGLTILKGVMDDAKPKIWARYVVESEGNRHVTRHEIFSSLIHVLQMTSQSSNDRNDRLNSAMSSGAPSLFNNCEPGVLFPVNLADGVQCGSLL